MRTEDRVEWLQFASGDRWWHHTDVWEFLTTVFLGQRIGEIRIDQQAVFVTPNCKPRLTKPS